MNQKSSLRNLIIRDSRLHSKHTGRDSSLVQSNVVSIVLGIGVCFLFICLYLFVAFVKICRGEKLSCLFVSAEESGENHQALEIKKPTTCQVRGLNEKSHVLIQDSYFVMGNKFNKEEFEKNLACEMKFSL